MNMGGRKSISVRANVLYNVTRENVSPCSLYRTRISVGAERTFDPGVLRSSENEGASSLTRCDVQSFSDLCTSIIFAILVANSRHFDSCHSNWPRAILCLNALYIERYIKYLLHDQYTQASAIMLKSFHICHMLNICILVFA